MNSTRVPAALNGKNTRRGFSLVEALVATLIFSIILLAGHITLLSGQSAWSTTDTQIRLRENLRQTLQRVSKELQESGSDSTGALQVTISGGTGINGSDVLRFSIPLCVCGNDPTDANGDAAYWGAPVTWGSTNCSHNVIIEQNGKVIICHLPPGNPGNMQTLQVAPSAVDTHLGHGDWLGTCAACSVDANKFIEYKINAGGQLTRAVLNSASAVVREDIFADNITDFQISLSADQNVVTITAAAVSNTNQNRQAASSHTLNVYLRNKG